jgi:integrase
VPTRKDKEGRWHAEVCIHGQRIHRILPPGSTKKDAETLEAELKKSVSTVEYTNDPPLSEVMALYMIHADTLRSPKSAKEHAVRIAPYISGRKASEAKTVAMNMIRDLSPTLKPATINRTLGTLKKGLSLAWEREMIPINYGEKIKRLVENNAREVYLSIDQVSEIADKASDNVKAAIWIAIYTGMRRGEIIKLRKEHISRDLITIPAGNTKTLKMRSVPIIDQLLPWLEYVPMTINIEGLKSGFRRAREAAGMPHVHFHDLRHSTASLLAHAGVDLHTISKILGHSTTRMSERYAHIKVDKQRDALNKVFGGR